MSTNVDAKLNDALREHAPHKLIEDKIISGQNLKKTDHGRMVLNIRSHGNILQAQVWKWVPL